MEVALWVCLLSSIAIQAAVLTALIIWRPR